MLVLPVVVAVLFFAAAPTEAVPIYSAEVYAQVSGDTEYVPYSSSTSPVNVTFDIAGAAGNYGSNAAAAIANMSYGVVGASAFAEATHGGIPGIGQTSGADAFVRVHFYADDIHIAPLDPLAPVPEMISVSTRLFFHGWVRQSPGGGFDNTAYVGTSARLAPLGGAAPFVQGEVALHDAQDSAGNSGTLITQTGVFASLELGPGPDFLVETVIDTPTLLLAPQTPGGSDFFLQLDLELYVRATAFLNSPGSVSSSSEFDHTLSLPTSGPVFTLPSGFTAYSDSGLIVDNRFVGTPAPVPEPPAFVLGLIGAIATIVAVSTRPGAETSRTSRG